MNLIINGNSKESRCNDPQLVPSWELPRKKRRDTVVESAGNLG